ncbi:midasin-like [Schistocerca piceifrons]|uniref:midasin-like n=1 Tax=Schistocerca piceifrons TaxID=274613 RepID=UPI001F5F4167|nr:midasin-like [Schistocerca piceifrons]
MKTVDQKTLLTNGLKNLWGQHSLKTLCAENVAKLSTENRQALLCYISHLLIQPSLTEQVAKNFPQIVLQLLHIAKDWNKLQTLFRNISPSLHIMIYENESERHKKICVALGKLIMFHPDALRFSLEYFEKYPAPFTYLFSHSEVAWNRAIYVDEQVSDYDIIASCYSFLSTSCDHFRQCWNWAAFTELLRRYKHNRKLMWVGLNCLATVTGMSDSERRYLLHGQNATENYLIEFDEYTEKLSNIKVVSSDILEAPSSDSCSMLGSVITVAGFQFPVVDPTKQRDEPLQRGVQTTEQNLRSLALALVSGRAICLQGPVGSGKTALVEHFANLTGRGGLPHLTKIQLGDQTDSKMLLGSYRCTDIPGEFVWQSGVLTEAVEKGYWLLLEDIDSAPSDLASVLASLLETRHLFVPGYRDSIPVARGFQLFLTRRFTKSGSEKISVSSSLLESHWITVDIKPLKKAELLQVVKGVFPVLEHSAENLINTFSVFSQGRHEENPEQMVKNPIKKRILEELKQKLGSGRLTSTRDLLKWAVRCSEVYKHSPKGNKDAALNVYADAVDIFCLSENKKDVRIAGAKAVGSFLSVLVDADNYLNVHKPTISETDRQITVGRATLLKKKTDEIAIQCAQRIALVPPVVRLLEGVARAIQFCEPVLLVGETGTGKTFLIQHLAQRTGNPLLVINMNQQSETTDLLGGYKPMDLKFIVRPVREKFERLVRNLAWEDGLKFLVKLAREYHSRNWKMVLLMMKRKTSSVLKKLRKKSNPSEEITTMISNWKQLSGDLSRLEKQISSNAMAFTFIEGSLVRAVREGKWVLLDEINLAPPETLECLSGLLEDGAVGSLRLLERGDEQPVPRHKDFRLFACMNPATDVGKKELPAGLRNRIVFQQKVDCDLWLSYFFIMYDDHI